MVDGFKVSGLGFSSQEQSEVVLADARSGWNESWEVRGDVFIGGRAVSVRFRWRHRVAVLKLPEASGRFVEAIGWNSGMLYFCWSKLWNLPNVLDPLLGIHGHTHPRRVLNIN
ncbi:hypothetical protein C1H46_029919 [Malus baccata]|uniref:Uncharacterized protein n=1 Tax=Malus baccata TaxID=106549 RepID=A0A540LDJ5_MALBA|nr:hypothetical protein C1H46_029919 [Malus baccata]